MIRGTPKTIRDYGRQMAAGTKPTAQRTPGRDTFRRQVHSAFQRHRQSPPPVLRNRTIQDYWRQMRPLKQHLALSSPNTAEPKPSPEHSPSPTPSLPAAQKGAHPLADVEQPAIRRQIDDAVQQAAYKYGLPAELVRSVVRHESNFNPHAVSPAGAQGLMQLMPATARELGVSDPFDIQQNIDGGSRYLKSMLDGFGGDLRKALAAYNAGPGTVRRYGDVPPYPETRAYVHKVMSSIGAAM